MREMKILLATSDLFFLYQPPPTPSAHRGHLRLAVRLPTRVRGVGAGLRLARAASGSNGFGNRSEVATTAYRLASSGRCHETIPLCHGAPHATRPSIHQQRQRTHHGGVRRSRLRPRLPTVPCRWQGGRMQKPTNKAAGRVTPRLKLETAAAPVIKWVTRQKRHLFINYIDWSTRSDRQR